MSLNAPHSDLTRVDRLLRDQAPAARRGAPADLHARVLSEINALPADRRNTRFPFAILIPTALAAAAALGFLFWPTPAPVGSSSPLALGVPLDPGPVIRPASRFVVGSVDKPLREQATLLVRDTQRATRVVIDCLPFASRGG
jgi:hypothetical protein